MWGQGDCLFTQSKSTLGSYPNMKTLLSFALVLACSLILLGQGRTQRPAQFHVEEKTIAQIHAALRTRQVTCGGLTPGTL
jgi:hypothetical protein